MDDRYHGHFNEQYVDGLVGALVVTDAPDQAEHDKNDAPYSVDSSNTTLIVTDYYSAVTSSLVRPLACAKSSYNVVCRSLPTFHLRAGATSLSQTPSM